MLVPVARRLLRKEWCGNQLAELSRKQVCGERERHIVGRRWFNRRRKVGKVLEASGLAVELGCDLAQLGLLTKLQPPNRTTESEGSRLPNYCSWGGLFQFFGTLSFSRYSC